MFLSGLEVIFDNATKVAFSNWVDVIFIYVWSYTLILGLYLMLCKEGKFLRLCKKQNRLSKRGKRISEQETEYILLNADRVLSGRQCDTFVVMVYFLISGVLFFIATLSGIANTHLEKILNGLIILILFIYIIGMVLCVYLFVRRKRLIRFGGVVKNALRKGK